VRWIYISPHFDDVVLSCGGLIWEQARQGLRVEIWTICAGEIPDGTLSDFAQVLHMVWDTGRETVTIRRQEDIAACRMVGALHRHLSIPDCIYRQGQDGGWLYASDEAIFGSLHPSDETVIETLRDFLALSLRSDDTVVCPLAIGGHVDHVLTRTVIERLGRSLLYYADIPYLLNHPEALKEKQQGMRAKIYPVTEDGVKTWQAGIAAYASQIGMLFESEEKRWEAIRGYWESRYGVRLWHVK
jgi:LmbE family N-acetylglucosaminyl deacetylase